MSPSPIANAVAQAIHDSPAYSRQLDDKAARENAAIAKRARELAANQLRGNTGNRGNSSPLNDLSVPSHAAPSGSTNGHSHFALAASGTPGYPPGVYWHPAQKDDDQEPPKPVWICSPLFVQAMTRDAHNAEWGQLLAFTDSDDKEHRWVCPQSLHAGSGEELRAALLRQGLRITLVPRLRHLIGEYIQSVHPAARVRTVERTGWHDDVFVLPSETIGDDDREAVLLQQATADGVSLDQSGTLKGWIDNVATRCAGNSRLVLAVAAGFAAPCLSLLRADGFGVHLRGASSTGKTTAQIIAASMYGPPARYKLTWRATDNGIEGTAAMHSDLLLVLDEIAQLDPRHAGQVAYMLANGQGKSRCDRDGNSRPIKTWRTLCLSSGEVALSDLVAQCGGTVRAGQEVRIIDVPADAGAGLGLFDSAPNGMKPGAFAETLQAAAEANHGHALVAFVTALTGNPDKARKNLTALREQIASQLTGTTTSGQVRRVAARFALIGAAGEYATNLRLTGWEPGEAEHAAQACFKAWLDARGTDGNAEPVAMLAQVRHFLAVHGEARFTPWDAPEEGTHTANRAGFRKHREDGPVYYIDPQCFCREVCKGLDYRAVARVLDKVRALEHDGDRRWQKRVRLPDRRNTRMYVVTPTLWAGEEGEP